MLCSTGVLPDYAVYLPAECNILLLRAAAGGSTGQITVHRRCFSLALLTDRPRCVRSFSSFVRSFV